MLMLRKAPSRLVVVEEIAIVEVPVAQAAKTRLVPRILETAKTIAVVQAVVVQVIQVLVRAAQVGQALQVNARTNSPKSYT
jgi:hypothetical protein